MKIFKVSTLFSIIYLGVIFSFFYNFFTNDETKVYNLNGLVMTEVSSIEYPLIPKRIRSFELKYKGIDFEISSKTPIKIVSDDNIKRSSKVISVGFSGNNVELKLENSIDLVFRVDNYGDRLTVISNIPKVFPTIKEIVFNFHLTPGYQLEEGDLSYKISNSVEEFHLKLNDKYYIKNSSNSREIHVVAQEDKVSTLTFSPLSASDLPLAEQWYTRNRVEYNQSVDSSISTYLDNTELKINQIYNRISFNTDTEEWRNIPKLSDISENAIIVYLAAAMKNGRYSENILKIKEIKRRYPNIFTYASTPFTGNIVLNGKSGEIKETERINEINQLIINSDKSLSSTWIPEYYFDGESINISSLENFINNMDKKNQNLESLIISLQNLVKILEKGTTISRTTDSLKEITDLILQKIKWDKTGLYLVDNSLVTQQELNYKAGKLLIDASQYATSEYSKPVGEGLIQTFLSNSNQNGEISELYNIESGEFSDKKLRPENLYLLLSDNPYIPHYFQSMGIKIWTISDSIVVSKSKKDIRITITYPVDSDSEVNSHFLTISGIPAYSNLYFKGKLWRPDINFERWGVGYYYDDLAKILFFEPNHTKPREEIVITYE